MADITLRTGLTGKGAPLTLEQVDQNFININNELGLKLYTSDFTGAAVLSRLLDVDEDLAGINSTFLRSLAPSSSVPSAVDKSSVVIRDSSGHFSAVTMTGDLTGNVIGDLTGIVYGSLDGPSEGLHTGNVVGNVSGTLTGPSFGLHTGDVTGNVTGSIHTATNKFVGNLEGNTAGVHTGNVLGNVNGTLNGPSNGLHTGNVTGNVTGTIHTASDRFIGRLVGNSEGTHTGPVIGNVTGSVSGNAGTVTNGLYTTGSYNNPSWLVTLAGSKVLSIPNSSLQNSSITINGSSVALGGSITTAVGAKAWVVFNGSNGAIISAYNVDTVLRTGAGRYTINIPVGVFTDGNYASIGMASDNDHVVNWVSSTATQLAVTTSDTHADGNNAFSNTQRVHVVMFG